MCQHIEFVADCMLVALGNDKVHVGKSIPDAGSRWDNNGMIPTILSYYFIVIRGDVRRTLKAPAGVIAQLRHTLHTR